MLSRAVRTVTREVPIDRTTPQSDEQHIFNGDSTDRKKFIRIRENYFETKEQCSLFDNLIECLVILNMFIYLLVFLLLFDQVCLDPINGYSAFHSAFCRKVWSSESIMEARGIQL